MVKNIMLTSTKHGSGKSVIAIGSYLKIKESGKKPGYFKPIGDSILLKHKKKSDKDVSIISEVIAKEFSREQLCPQFLNPEFYLDEILPEESVKIMEKIKDTFNDISKNNDITLIEGNHTYYQYASVNLDDITIAKELNAHIVICAKIEDDNDFNLVISTFNHIKIKNLPVLGVILSPTTKIADDRIEKYYISLLNSKGIPYLGGLKKSKQLEKPTIEEILDAVNGKLITSDYICVKDNFIDGFVIGAMGAAAATTFMKKAQKRNQCVITGGDRTDMALSALETNAGIVIFSGNIDPSEKVIELAKNKKIPLMVSPADTFTITEQIRKIHTNIQKSEISLCKEQVETNINWQIFLQ